MNHRILKSQLRPFLIGHDKKTGAHTYPQMAAYNKQCRRFHLRCQTAHPLPGFPFILQLIAHRHQFRRMLSVKGILALNNPGMIRHLQGFRCRNKGCCHTKIRHCRVFNRRIFFAGALHTDCSRGNNDVTAFHIRLHAAAGSDSDKGICTTAIQLFHGNRG